MWLVCMLAVVFLAVYNPCMSSAAEAGKKAKAVKADPIDKWQAKPNAAYDAGKMGDMSDFDAGTIVSPSGDTIKIAVVASFSGPGAWNGQIFWHCVQWAAYDINKRGGIFVDGKKKLVEVIKADHMSKADQCKKICERMALQEKVHAFWGTDGSNMMRIMNEVANKYKIISSMAHRLPTHSWMPLILAVIPSIRPGRPSRSGVPLPIITARSARRKSVSIFYARTTRSGMKSRMASKRA